MLDTVMTHHHLVQLKILLHTNGELIHSSIITRHIIHLISLVIILIII